MEPNEIEEAASSIMSDILPAEETVKTKEAKPVEGAEEVVVDEGTGTAPPPEVKEDKEVVVHKPPQSWAKEKHEIWAKLPPEAQEQFVHREKQMLEGLEQYKGDAGLGRSMRETITPYKALLSAQGVDEVKATSYLLNAHYKLSTLPMQQRAEYLLQVAKSYGIDTSALPATAAAAPPDPRLAGLEQTVSELKNTLTSAQAAQLEEAKGRITNDVNAFAAAKDEKGVALHPYFDEVSDETIVHIKAGKSLEEAYKAAVWANPVTRQKELARLQTESKAKLLDKSKQEAEAAKKAAAANVRSRDTRKAPTGPMGKMDDTMRETLAEIKARTTH